MSDLVGAWSLASYRLVGSRGRERYPYGEDAIGCLLYTPEGSMAVSIMSRERTPFRGTDILRRTKDEAAEATRTYLSYCGTYTVQGCRVIHHVALSLFPNWTGTDQVRYFRLTGNVLELSTHPMDEQLPGPRAELVWRRKLG